MHYAKDPSAFFEDIETKDWGRPSSLHARLEDRARSLPTSPAPSLASGSAAAGVAGSGAAGTTTAARGAPGGAAAAAEVVIGGAEMAATRASSEGRDVGCERLDLSAC